MIFIYDNELKLKFTKKQIQGVQQQNGTECDITGGFEALKFTKDLNIRGGTP